jgi:hypothetical protein
MADRWVPIWQTVGAAYGLGLRSVLRFPIATLAVSTVLLGINSYTVPLSLDGIVGAPLLVLLLNDVLRAVVLAPFAILIHRSIILGDNTGTYWTMGTHRRAAQFVLAALLLVLVQEVTSVVNALNRYSGWFILPGLVCTIASLVFDIRLCLAFPAIATDQSATPIRESFRIVRGSGLPIFFVFLFIGLCWAPIGIPLFFADRLRLMAEKPELLFALRVVQQLVATLMIAIGVAAASQLWKTRANWSEAVAPPAVATP